MTEGIPCNDKPLSLTLSPKGRGNQTLLTTHVLLPLGETVAAGRKRGLTQPPVGGVFDFAVRPSFCYLPRG